MSREEKYYMEKLDLEDIENVAGGLTEEEAKFVEQARRDQEEFADFGDDPWNHSKKNKQSSAARKALAAVKK